MNNFDIQKLRDLPIEAVAQQLGMKVQKHKALCPYHPDKHASLSFYTKRNTFRCFACGAHGNTISLAMEILNKNFKEACHWLASDYPSCHPEQSEGSREHQAMEITQNSKLITEKYSKYFERPFLNQPARTFLFQERKLHPAVIRWCRLTSWTDRYGTPWLQIPYFDTDGKLIGVQNRRLGKGEGPRFIFPKGSQCRIYNLPILNLLKEGEELWITEGCSDCWAMLSSGKKALAIPSATLLRAKDLEVLRTHNSKLITLHMYPDNDTPGENLYLQLKEHCPQLVRHQLSTNYKDYSEYYASNY